MKELHYYQFGEPDLPVLLMLHGFMGSGGDFRPIASHLTNHYFVIAPDLTGHGKNLGYKRGEFSMQATAHAVIELLDEANVERCVGMGYSMGGRLLLYLATHFPERFERIILESSSPGLVTHAERMQRKQWDLLMAERLRKMNFEAFLRQWYEMPLFETFRTHPKFEEAFARRLRNDPQQLALSMEEMGTGSMGSLWEGWAQLKRDSLLIVGEHDAKYRNVAREMARVNERAEVVVVDGAGHNVHFEQPKRFSRLLLK